MYRMKLISALSCIALLFSLSACGSGSNVSAPEGGSSEILNTSSQQEPSQIENPSVSDSETGSEEADNSQDENQATHITMTVGDVIITAELDDSETTKEFIATLPRTLTMNRYDDREYYGRIEAITENGEAIPDFTDGDVTYYPAGPSFAVFFAGEERSDQSGLIRMGKVTSDLSVFDDLGDAIEVQIDFA